MTNKTVRPIMTVEARDVLDKMHRIAECSTRSESIISYHNLSVEIGRANINLNDKLKQWKLIAWPMTAACIALIATMMITAS